MFYCSPWMTAFWMAFLFSFSTNAKSGTGCLEGLRGRYEAFSEVSTPDQGPGETYSYRSLLQSMRGSSEFTFKSQKIKGLDGEFIAIEPISVETTQQLGASWDIHLLPLHRQANFELLLKEEALALALMKTRGSMEVEEGALGKGAGSPLTQALVELRDQYFLEQNQFYIFLLGYLKTDEKLQRRSGHLERLLKKWELTVEPGNRVQFRGYSLYGEMYLSARDRSVILQELYDHWSAQPWKKPNFDHYMTQLAEKLFVGLSADATSAKGFAAFFPSQEMIALRSLVHFNQEFWNLINLMAHPLQFTKTIWLDVPEKSKLNSDLARSINGTGIGRLLPELHDPRPFYRFAHGSLK